MKGKLSPEYKGSDELYNKGESVPNKLSDTRSLKTSALTGERNWLSKSSKHKQAFMLWSSGLQAFNLSVKHLTQLEKRTQRQEISLT